MDYSASSSAFDGVSPESLATNKEQIMDQVKQQMALAEAQTLLAQMNQKCFPKCIPKPGSRLESSEQTCMGKCMDRYLEAWNIVSKAMYTRITKEANRYS